MSNPRGCVFCGGTPLTKEHVLPWWVRSATTSEGGRALHIRQSGKSTGERWEHSREGDIRDVKARVVCASCNNGWMNQMDAALATLGPQLLKGRELRLTKGKQASLAAWAVKTILMLQHIHRREDRFVIPDEDYATFFAERQPSQQMRLWTAYMEPPGKYGGNVYAFGEYRHDELFYNEEALRAHGLDPALACRGYSAVIRIGHCVIGLVEVGSPEVLTWHKAQPLSAWTEIWPAMGTRDWPPRVVLKPKVRLNSFVPELSPER